MKKIINNFKIIINSDRQVIKYSKPLNGLIKSKKESKICIEDMSIFQNDSFKLTNLIKEAAGSNNKNSGGVTLNIKNKLYSYNAEITPLKNGIKKFDYEIKFKIIKNLDQTLSNLSAIVAKKYSGEIKKIAKNICKTVSKDIALTNLFFFNDQNYYSIKYWDISSETTARFMTESDKMTINYLKKRIDYNYLTLKKVDDFVDLIFESDSAYFIYTDSYKEINYQDYMKIIDADCFDMLTNYLETKNLKYISFIPLYIKNYRLGFIAVFNEKKFSELEIDMLNNLKNSVKKIIEDSGFIKLYRSEHEDINNISVKLPNELYKMLYYGIANINNINNIYDLKIFCAKELKKLTFSDTVSYCDINMKENVLNPIFIDECDEIKSYLEKHKLNLNVSLMEQIIKLRSIFFYNSNEKNIDYEIYNSVNTYSSYLFCPLFLNSEAPSGIFILSKVNSRNYNIIESTIANTFFKHTLAKYKEIVLIKENIDSKMKYKALYETILSLSSSNSFYTTLDIIAKITSSLVSTETVILYKIDDDKNYLTAIYSNEKVEIRIKTFSSKAPVGKYLLGEACIAGETKFMNYEDYNPDIDSCPDKIKKSMMAIPLKIKDELLGGMVLIRYNHINFDYNDLETIIPFAQQAINIVYQNLLLQKNNETKDVYKALYEIQSELNDINSPELALQNIISKSSVLTHSSKTIALSVDENQNVYKIISWIQKNTKKDGIIGIVSDIKDNIIGHSIRSRKPIMTNYDKSMENDLSEFERSFLELSKYSALFYPFIYNNKIICIVVFERGNLEKFFINDIQKISLFFETVGETIFKGAIAKNLKIKKYLSQDSILKEEVL